MQSPKMNDDSLQEQIQILLQTYAINEFAKNSLSVTIAQKAQMMNHLYEDLDLQSREQMNALMCEYFPVLAAKKPHDIRWKKFLFDTIGAVAPACKSCYDQTNCFGCELKVTTGGFHEFAQNCYASI